MGAHKQQSKAVQLVYKQGAHYICGMCRRNYASRQEAQACLKEDMDEVVEREPVKAVRQGRKVVYQCQVCKRKYAESDDAFSCVAACRKDLDKEAQMAAAVNGQALEAPTRKTMPRKALPVMVKAQPRVKFGKPDEPKGVQAAPAITTPEPDLEEVKAPAPAPEEPPQQTDFDEMSIDDDEPAAAETAPKPEPSTAESGKKAKFKKPFHRDQANYVCNYCNEKYFTKMEVQACWDAHPD